jgi:NAD(P)-dependent dehydrogenase (short-subunit alcohol dehydrogenase family)
MDSSHVYAVTGAASGIGRAVAELLVARGARVFAMDVNEDGLRSLQGIVGVPADVASAASTQKAGDMIRAQTSGLNGLVNCAGVIRCGASVEWTEDDVQAVMQVNALGAYRTTRELFSLLQQRRGRVVNISSETARFSAPFNGLYSMSKWALEAYSDALRRELALLGMKVVIIQPGAMRTALLEATVPCFDRALPGSGFEVPMRRIRNMAAKEKGAPPEQVASVVLRALTHPQPRARYRVGHNVLRRVIELLPVRWADAVVASILRG